MKKNVIFIFLIDLLFCQRAFSLDAETGKALPLYSITPFVCILLIIALFPLIFPRWWEHNINKLFISLILSAPILFYYLKNNPYSLLENIEEYFSFIILLGSLYIISGGILLTGDIPATPLSNTLLLGIGSLFASFIGTTGASMLLIRPILKINEERSYKKHTVIFFIFLVSNIGGCLTPLGDPPLYMGYLEGVPFIWTFKLFIDWLFMVLLVLLFYFIYDSIKWKMESEKAKRKERTIIMPIKISGIYNLLLLSGIIACVAFLPYPPYREMVMILLAAISLKITPKNIRKENEFTYYPIIEVAVLFLGIFITMVPALDLLYAKGDQLGIIKPWQFFWATGCLSSFLDNTPTYLTFLSLAQGLKLKPEIIGVSEEVLKAISLGAVFMGAMTYIGNGPNFMVKAIAEERKVSMPSFFGYMIYSIIILIPLFIIHTIIFI